MPVDDHSTDESRLESGGIKGTDVSTVTSGLPCLVFGVRVHER
jgi:hypothetical protein